MTESHSGKPLSQHRLKIAMAVGGVIFLVTGLMIYSVFWGPNEFQDEEQKIFFVSRGSSFTTITDSLEAQGIIRSRRLFVFVAKLFGGTDRMQIGKYVLPSGISNVDLFLSLREGTKSVLIPVTLREGEWAKRFAGVLARSIGVDSARYLTLVNDERFARSLGIGRSSLEGYLLPETYKFHWQQSEESIIREQVRLFWNAYDDSLKLQARTMGWSMHDVVTLASIIEGEIVLGEERERVSGVYHNRLRRGMRLQADPTIQYFIEGGPRRVTYDDLKIDHPYNTYRHNGLPPGPVNNPGRASLAAALNPEAHNFLYFVANGKGGHWFSSSYSQHLRHVQKFRRGRAKRQADPGRQSSPQVNPGGF